MTAGWMEQKRRWRQYKARKELLPASYHTAIDALERYTSYFGHGTAEGGLAMLEYPMDLIVGYPTIRQADWLFDFPARRWTVY